LYHCSRQLLALTAYSARDIDCAFPSREEPDEDEDEEPRRDRDGNIIKPSQNIVPAKSAVTLSGLLNVLDSVSNEEGRLTFATVRFCFDVTNQATKNLRHSD
jgi:chaperone BCS1